MDPHSDLFSTKLRLLKAIYPKVHSMEEFLPLYKFLDLSFQLSEEEEYLILDEIKKLEEVNKMPYITSIERIGIEKGIKEGALLNGREMVLELLNEYFGEVTLEISSAINKVEDTNELKKYLRYAIRCCSLDEFKNLLNGNKK